MNKEANKAEREVLKMAEKTEMRETYRFLEAWVFGDGEFQKWVAPFFPNHFKVWYFSNPGRPLELLNEGESPALILVNADSSGESGLEFLKTVQEQRAVQRVVVDNLRCEAARRIWTGNLPGLKMVDPEELSVLLDTIPL
ncbi:hypothetical protein HYW31_02610 [Candidatus Berkelbacteria bacterium]|nr:hypothetical protein [Candidatus Berkelbacteria bacterium]